MQNSELYRQGIVVPLDSDAEQALYQNNVDENTKVEFLDISGGYLFGSLWDIGLFEKLNQEASGVETRSKRIGGELGENFIPDLRYRKK